MPEFSSVPRIRFADPTLTPALAAFRCGDHSDYEREVNGIVADLYAGVSGRGPVILAEDGDTGHVIGLCWFTPRPIPPPTLVPDAAYIAVIGVDERFRGWRIPGGQTIGDLLLGQALHGIEVAWGGGPMPPVWALVDTDNAGSHRLFDRHGFGRIPAASGSKYDWRYRRRGLPI